MAPGAQAGVCQRCESPCSTCVGDMRRRSSGWGGQTGATVWPQNMAYVRGIYPQNMALYGTVPPIYAPEIPIEISPLLNIQKTMERSTHF